MFSLGNEISRQANEAALLEMFNTVWTYSLLTSTLTLQYSLRTREVKARLDSKNRQYAFAQFNTAEEAKTALQKCQGVIIHGRPIRIEHARVNRTIFLSPKANEKTIDPIVSIVLAKRHTFQLTVIKSLKSQVSKFGEVEDFLFAQSAQQLLNATEFLENEWFIRFAYRDDAIKAYTDPDLNEVNEAKRQCCTNNMLTQVELEHNMVTKYR